ncbi:hypothetical protein GX51_00094 [Blastomyces parvus]|uniref:Microbial-type PARG catalytic domain-containing protein n=1 Tax=Blastomyces parvus TaxID=2060905 RepID=A0A2B7XP77_9EURO|nr:hypothetical protein GX51_00094 [Blastomyces parvus]
MSNPARGTLSAASSPRGRGRGHGPQDARGFAGQPSRSRGQNRGRGPGRGRGRGIVPNDRAQLQAISRETETVIPSILNASQNSTLLREGILYQSPRAPPRLDRKFCPGFTGTKIMVLEADTFDAAIQLFKDSSNNKQSSAPVTDVAVLNMASDFVPGGGWLSGAQAQEEALCRRSTLTASLQQHFYPTPSNAVIYSPAVIVFRDCLKHGHGLMDLSDPDSLPLVSVISMAALRRPGVIKGPNSLLKFASPKDRDLTKEKMRVILRLSAWKRHRKLVLGALGCGAFRNPPEEVADCWAEVFSEPEFCGGWWEKVVFAVIDEMGLGAGRHGNKGIFFGRLDGIEIGARWPIFGG